MNTFKRPIRGDIIDEDEPCNEEFNVVLLGDWKVGKTSFIFKCSTNMYSEMYIPTTGIDIRKINMETTEGRKVALRFWDTPGSKQFDKKIIKDLFCISSAFLILYDVTSINSYNSIHEWMMLIRKYSLDKSQLVVIGTKTDLKNERKVTKEEGMKAAATYGAKFMEVNVPHNRNIDKTLNRLAINLTEKSGL